MNAQVTITRQNDQVSISGPYSPENHIKYRSIGGESVIGAECEWVFKDIDAINKIIEELFGLSETLVTVKIYDYDEAIIWRNSGITIGGYRIASKNFFANLIRYHETAFLISGKSPSGESETSIGKKLIYKEENESVFGLVVRKDFAEKHNLEVIEEHNVLTDIGALADERVKLLARIAEIDLLLSV